MMGGSCSRHHDVVHSNQRRRRAGGGGRAGGRGRSRSFSSAVGRLCGGSLESSDEESGLSAKCPKKRAARHSVDAEVPDQSIAHLYPTDDNYVPHPADATLRQPKSLSDLCIEAVCRSLPDLEGDLPPHLPQEVVDRIVASLTSRGALNSTTLRALRRCELGSLSLANCRGVRDDWLIPLSSSSVSSDLGDDRGGGRGCGFACGGGGDGTRGRLRSASTASYEYDDSGNFGHNGGYLSLSLPSSPHLHPAQYVQVPHSASSSSFLLDGTGSSGSMMMMDLDDYDEVNSSAGLLDRSSSSSGNHHDILRPLPLPGERSHREREGQTMMEDRSYDHAMEDDSRSTSSFVSASSTPYVAGEGGSDGDDEEDVRDGPDLFSPRWSPPATPSPSPWLCPRRGHGGDDAPAFPSLPDPVNADDDPYGDDAVYRDKASYPPAPSAGLGSAAAAALRVLDLRGSQRLTDRGLLQLARTPLRSLEVARLDNCHGVVGRGLLAFSRSTALRTLSLANCRRLTDEAVVNVGHLGGSLECLNLGGCRCLTDRSLEAIAHLAGLRKLDLSQCDLITDDGLVNLHGVEFLDELSLGWCRLITDDGLAILAEQPNRSNGLITLRLARCSITDEGLPHLAKLESLEELDLNGCVRVSSAGLGDCLARLARLASLDVSYCPGILRSSWQGKVDALRSLELCYSGVRDSQLARLRSLPNLEELNLDSCIVADWGIAHLVDNNVVPNLTSLDLADTDISDAAMGKIAKLENIQKLSLFYCNISNRGLRHIASMSSLEVLNLDSRDIGDDGLRYLRGLPLKSLDLFSSRVTDIGCVHLSKIKTLTSLELCGGGIADFGCAHLATLSNLTSLNLSQNESITNRGAASLAALTNLKALNLSNTCVTPDALKFFGGLVKLQSLALYGCKDMEESPERLGVLQSELPSLRCLRLNSPSNEDGVIDHNVETEDEEEDDDGDDDVYYEEVDDEGDGLDDELQQGLIAHAHHRQMDDNVDSMGSSGEDGSMSDFQDANEVQSVDTASQQSRNMDYDV